MRIVEVRVRTFHTDGDIDVTPSASMTLNIASAADVFELVTKCADICDGILKDAPVPDLRSMTPAEIQEFLETERAEESGNAVVIGN